MPALATPQHRRDAALARRALDALERARDLFALGAYQPGGDVWLDVAVSIRAELESLVFDGDNDDDVDAVARAMTGVRRSAARTRARSSARLNGFAT